MSTETQALESLARTAIEVDAEFRDFANAALPWLKGCRGHALSGKRREALEGLISAAEDLLKGEARS